MGIRILILSIMVLGTINSIWAQVDSSSADIRMNPELMLQPDTILAKVDLDRQPWFTDMAQAMRQPRKVYKLSLAGQKYKDFPREILRFPNIQMLDLSDNKIKTIPDEISDLQNLQVLILSYNKLRYLPDGIKNLDNLEALYMRSNRMVEMPAWVGGLSKLRYIDVTANQLLLYDIELLAARLPKCEVVH